MTGGVGREASKLQQTVVGMAQGDDVPAQRRHAEEAKGLRQEGRGEEAIVYVKENPQARFALAATAAERQVKAMREHKRALENEGAPREAIRAQEARMVARMEAFTALAGQ